jgi:hypothetical protein
MGKKYWTSFKNTTNNHLGGCVVPINGIPFLLPPFQNIRCFRFVKRMYLDMF